MFDNLIGHNNIKKLLINDINNNSLSNAMIFLGNKFSGRLTASIEFTRIINCLDNKKIDCKCNNCKRINDFNFEGLVLLSRRDNSLILNNLILSYGKNNDSIYIEKIINLLKITFLPLQDFLIKDAFNENEKNEINKIAENIFNIVNNTDYNLNNFKKAYDAILKLQNLYKKMNIPVNSIRSMLEWTYISQPDINRVVIVDHVDLLEKSSQNILLKRLEEPSKNLYFILIAENLNNIVKTILSRCRTYYFKKLNQNDINIIIKNEFNDSGDFKSLSHYLFRNDELSLDNIFPIIIKLLNLVFLKEAPFFELISFINAYNEKKIVKTILIELSRFLEKELSRREIGLNEESDLIMLKTVNTIHLKFLNTMITENINKLDIYSLNPILLLEGIFYPLKAMAQYDQI